MVDWGFNVAIAAGLCAVLGGLASLAWLLGSAAGPGASATLLAEAAPTTPEAFAQFVRAEHAKYEKIVKASGARAD